MWTLVACLCFSGLPQTDAVMGSSNWASLGLTIEGKTHEREIREIGGRHKHISLYTSVDFSKINKFRKNELMHRKLKRHSREMLELGSIFLHFQAGALRHAVRTFRNDELLIGVMLLLTLPSNRFKIQF